jgi:CheY-like chemotaxis protein
MISSPPVNKRNRILLVDDNEDALLATRLLLEHEGYEVTATSAGDAALAAYRAQPFDLVITDLLMPDMDGVELLAALHSDFPEAKVLVISGITSRPTNADYMFAVRQAGALDTLSKPFEVPELLAKVEALLVPR